MYKMYVFCVWLFVLVLSGSASSAPIPATPLLASSLPIDSLNSPPLEPSSNIKRFKKTKKNQLKSPNRTQQDPKIASFWFQLSFGLFFLLGPLSMLIFGFIGISKTYKYHKEYDRLEAKKSFWWAFALLLLCALVVGIVLAIAIVESSFLFSLIATPILVLFIMGMIAFIQLFLRMQALKKEEKTQ